MSTVAAVESLCCRSKTVGEGVAGFSAKVVAVGLTCSRLKLVGEATMDFVTISVEGVEGGGGFRT